jgi:hypothetical protein
VGWGPAREETAAEAALAGAGQVEVSGVATLEEGTPAATFGQVQIE